MTAEQAREFVIDCAVEALRPPARMPLMEWMERNVRLRAEESPDAAGPYRRDKSIPMGKLFEKFNAEREWRRLYVKKSSRTAFTLHCLGDLVQHIATRPRNMIFAIDSEKEAKRISRKRLQPMLEDCELTAGLWAETEGEQNTLEFTFPGMSLWLVGAGSAGALANKAAARSYADEVDKHKVPRGEAGTLDLLEQRGKGISGAVMIAGSTPTVETGTIAREHLRGSCHVYEVPCPHCGEMQELEWNGVKFGHCKRPAGGGYDLRRVLVETFYECRACRGAIEEGHKLAMMEGGDWRPTNFEELEGEPVPAWEPGIMSAHLSDLYSIDADSTWGEIAVQWIRAQGDPLKLQNFRNGRLGLEEREAVVEVKPAGVRRLISSYQRGSMPEVPCLLTIQADNQGSEIVKWMVSGWLPGGSHYVVDWGTAEGREALDEVVRRKFDCGGRLLSPQRGIMDEGGEDGTTWEVRRFCKERGQRWLASKGQAGRQISHLTRFARASVAKGGLDSMLVLQFDDDAFKRLLYLQRIGKFDPVRCEEEGLPRMYLPADASEQLVRELSGEQLRRVKGKVQWVASPPNDFGDCAKLGEVLWNVIGGQFQR